MVVYNLTEGTQLCFRPITTLKRNTQTKLLIFSRLCGRYYLLQVKTKKVKFCILLSETTTLRSFIDISLHGRHLQGKRWGRWGGGGQLRYKNIYCKCRRGEATLGGCLNLLKNEGHCGSDFCFLSCSVYCTCSEYLDMGRE